MSLINAIEKAIFLTQDEKIQLEAEGYILKVEDTIDDSILRVSFEAHDLEDAIIGLSFIRSVTRGYGNIHIMELLASSPSKIVSREVTFGMLIKLHHYALEHLLQFASERIDNKMFVYHIDDYQNTINVLLS